MSHLEKYGCRIETETELKSFEQHENHVVFQLKKMSSNGTEIEEEAKASYIVGADGTRGFYSIRYVTELSLTTRQVL